MVFSQPYLFECAWEVANKVGGIYTVIKTKARVTVEEYGERYCLLGPLAHKTASLEVEHLQKSHSGPLNEAIRIMRSQGVNVVYGRWLIEGAPFVVLFDLESVRHRVNEWKSNLWETAQLPTPDNDFETNDAIAFGYVVAWFLGEYSYQAKLALEQARREAQLTQTRKYLPQNPVIIAQFHEWLAGVGLLLIRIRKLEVATIFTTHATLLGRYLCAGDVDFYNHLRDFDVDYEAGKRGIYHRYCIERGAAHSADVFTTVSHITAYEAEWLLKRRPDGVVPNGLNVVQFSALHEFQNLHVRNKEKINDFVRGHFYGHLNFDLDNTIYLFTAGRYEYRNKGVDMFIESLARLNHRLKESNSSTTVVAFIIMPAATLSYAVEALKGQAAMKQLRDTVTEIQNEIGKRMFEDAARGNLPDRQNVVREEEIVSLKRRVFALKRDTLPPIVTHNMADDRMDPILSHIRRVHLFNENYDRVKIIFHPEFLSSTSPLFSIDYDDFVRGCHLGVFPSYYEPWGYTPAECTVMGIPSITTNLSGFGCFMEEMIEQPKDYGIYIVDRRLKSVDESVNQLTDYMVEFISKSRRQRINQRNRTERLSDLLDWKRLGLEYMKARWVAIRRKWPSFVDRADDDSSSVGSTLDADTSANGPAYSAANNVYIGEPPQLFGPITKKLPRPPSVPGSPIINDSDGEDVSESGINDEDLDADGQRTEGATEAPDADADESEEESEQLEARATLLSKSEHMELPTLTPLEFEQPPVSEDSSQATSGVNRAVHSRKPSHNRISVLEDSTMFLPNGQGHPTTQPSPGRSAQPSNKSLNSSTNSSSLLKSANSGVFGDTKPPVSGKSRIANDVFSKIFQKTSKEE